MYETHLFQASELSLKLLIYDRFKIHNLYASVRRVRTCTVHTVHGKPQRKWK